MYLRPSVLMLLSWLPLLRAQCPESAEELFLVSPSDRTVEAGETVTFRCQFNSSIIPQWEYMLFNSTTPTTVNINSPETIALGYEISQDGDVSVLTVPDVQSKHAGKYICGLSLFFCEQFERSAFLRVAGHPEIFLRNDTYHVDTLGELSVLGTIRGHPSPNVLIYREIDGDSQLISSESNSRFSFQFDAESGALSLTFRGVIRADGGSYLVHAFNEHGSDNETFIIMPRGPDPPVVSLEPVVVSEFGNRVEAVCSIQPDAYEMGANPIQWTDINDDVVMSTTESDPVFITDMNDGSVVLTITTLSSTLTGTYTCTASNDRATALATVTVFGPPPPPNDITIRSGNNVTWTRPMTTDAVIGQYAIYVYQADNNVVELEDRVTVFPNHTTAYYVIRQDLPSGSYEVTVASISGTVVGEQSPRKTFEASLGGGEFPLITVVVAAAAGGVLLVLVVVIVVVVCCYCSYNTRRRKVNSHQQRWGSEEDKVGSQQHSQHSQPTVPNSYTAIAVHEISELPPSPLSPMPSSVGIDPKWEFPRENIKPLDVLAEGQFTVLYKGVAKNLKEKPCEVAIKALKDDATEDDLKALVYEIDVLSGIEEHPNIVSLVRVCSIGKPLYMIMEYMCHGDLLGFLRACRGHHGMYTVSPGNRYQPPSLQLCSRDLLNMATKIANGMRYLADRKIVHRALCTRNVLVGSGMDVKIYNVGSFDMALDNREDGLVKWMAPETLFDGTNTTYSDVWSFGVTLWELVTVGGTPYGEILPEDLYAQLQSGMRMPCPPHCAQEVYEIMTACWQKNPTDRPHFSIIHESLDELVMSKLNYLDLRSYDGYAYSQFGDDVPQLSTAL